MKLESLNCNNCGAPLQVPAGVNHLTCNHCGTQLVVRRTESISYTEKLAEVDQRTAELADKVAVLQYQSALHDIDRAWERERETYLVRGKNGETSEPSVVGSVIGMIFIIGFGIFWTALVASSKAPAPLILFGLLFCCGGFGLGRYHMKKAGDFHRARDNYRRRRSELTPEGFRETTSADESFLEQLGEPQPEREFLSDLGRRDDRG